LLLSILQESIGRLATIAFAHRLGTALEPECKLYRLLADVLNDAAFLLDCLSPALPSKPLRVLVLSASAVLRALCGVAAGSAKASLSAHFARAGDNLGELNAKDSSQETIISLLGLLVGSAVVTHVVSRPATWGVLVFLLGVHLETNRRAVRAVRMRVMNRQRATLVWHHLRKGRVPTLEEIAREERIFERDGVLRAEDGAVVGHCAVGVSLGRLTRALSSPDVGSRTITGAVRTSGMHLSTILEVYTDSPYVLWSSNGHLTSSPPPLPRPQQQLLIVLKKHASKRDVLVAWWQALAICCPSEKPPSSLADKQQQQQQQHTDLDILQTTRREALSLLKKYEEPLKQKGWDLDGSVLETVAGTRISIG
jgi:hypothetical protein